MSKKVSKNIKNILRVFLAFFLLGYILLTNDLPLVFEYFLKIPLFTWIIVLAIQIFQVLVETMRFSTFYSGKKFLNLLHMHLVTTAYALILPGNLATESFRAYMLGKEGKKYGRSSVVVIINKLIGLLVLLLMGAIGLLITRSLEAWIATIFILCAITLILILFSLKFSFLRNLVYKLILYISNKGGKIKELSEHTARMLHHWENFTNVRIIMIKAFILSTLMRLTTVVIGAILTHAMGLDFLFFDWLWIQALLTFALMIPLTLGGFGVREAGLIGMLSVVSVMPEQALAVSFGFLFLKVVQGLTGIILEFYMLIRKRGG